MKKYSKTYEDVYTADRLTSRCSIEHVGTDVDLDGPEYRDLMRKTIINFHKDIFDNLVKSNWLMRRFCYKGIHREKKRSNGWIDRPFGIFMRHHVGIESRMITRDQVFSKITSYFNDFFPHFDTMDPFKEKLEFPYKNISLEYLVVVYQMRERLELLDEAEEKKLGYTEFLDYVINYIYSYNEDAGEDYYVFAHSHVYMPYIKINKKYEDKLKTGDIREG